jgi:hypothetical protein
MSNKSISATDQYRRPDWTMAYLLASAERELSAFVAAVHQLFGAERAQKAAENWIEELARMDWPSEVPAIVWRRITIAAAAKLAGNDKCQLSRN